MNSDVQTQEIDINPSPIINQPPKQPNQSRKRKSPKKPTREDVQKAILLQQVGFKIKEIAKIEDIHRVTLWKYLKEFQVDNKELKEFENNLQSEILKSCLDDLNLSKRVINYFTNLDDDSFKKLTPTTMLTLKRSNDVGIGIKVEKYRLAAGLSTQIMGYADALKARDTAKITFEEIRRIRIERQSVADSNIVDISPALDTQGIEESA